MSEVAGTGGGPDIVVRRCDVTVVRDGGWSWGPAPRDLVRRVVEALPALVTAHLERDEDFAAAARTTVDGDVEITEPVRVVVSLSLADLIAGRVPSPTVSLPAGRPFAPEAAPPAATPSTPPAAATTPPAVSAAPAVGAAVEPPAVPGLEGLTPLLAALADRGELGHLLDTLPPATRTALAATTADPTGSAAPHRTPRTGEVEVGSVLPFLVAAALDKIDLLAPIGPLAGDPRTFAAGLAYKVLSPPRHGWRRSTADVEAAAAFAGLDGSVPDDALTSLGQRARDTLPVLDSLVGLAVCRGHDPDRPLAVTAAGGGLLLVEPDGLFPVAWEDDGAELVPFWEASGRPLLVAAGDAAVDDLMAAGVPLVTGTPPAGAGSVRHADPGRAWRRLPGAGRRWIAGPTDAWAGGRLALRAATADLTGPAAAAGELMAAMAARPAAPRASHPGLERTLTLLATAGLGTIAWLLWRHREPTDPQLALTRLGDLGGLVRFDADEVRVRLPYGRRHDDLAAHGLLADVPDVSWLDGRTLTFGRG
ncbi:hypothetical protein ACTMTJ_13635 [Phytohabitans sp. LJ34]|uniref:hypothetical protein n=1 Tax=Phytohabitans sp. LJ34 TaxID=3452217 RepID=UPI003F8965C2